MEQCINNHNWGTVLQIPASIFLFSSPHGKGRKKGNFYWLNREAEACLRERANLPLSSLPHKGPNFQLMCPSLPSFIPLSFQEEAPKFSSISQISVP